MIPCLDRVLKSFVLSRGIWRSLTGGITELLSLRRLPSRVLSRAEVGPLSCPAVSVALSRLGAMASLLDPLCPSKSLSRVSTTVALLIPAEGKRAVLARVVLMGLGNKGLTRAS